MSATCNTARDRAIRLENFAAELTGAVYILVLKRRPKSSWLDVELDLWKALERTVKTWCWKRADAPTADELETWREGLLADLTESAFYIALKNGIGGSLFDLELGLYRAVRQVTDRYRRVRQVSSP